MNQKFTEYIISYLLYPNNNLFKTNPDSRLHLCQERRFDITSVLEPYVGTLTPGGIISTLKYEHEVNGADEYPNERDPGV